MLNSLTLDSNKNAANWIITGISSEKVKLFDCSLATVMSNLGNLVE